MPVLCPGRIRIWSVGFCGGRKPGEPGKTLRLNLHMVPDRNRTRATLVGGEHSHLCAISASLGPQSQFTFRSSWEVLMMMMMTTMVMMKAINLFMMTFFLRYKYSYLSLP